MMYSWGMWAKPSSNSRGLVIVNRTNIFRFLPSTIASAKPLYIPELFPTIMIGRSTLPKIRLEFIVPSHPSSCSGLIDDRAVAAERGSETVSS